MKVWQAFLALVLLGALVTILVVMALSLPLPTFLLVLTVLSICLFDKGLLNQED